MGSAPVFRRTVCFVPDHGRRRGGGMNGDGKNLLWKFFAAYDKIAANESI
jgi:hypothetical protein